MGSDQSLVIRKADSDDMAEWNAWLSTSENGSFYHRYEWRDIVKQEFNHDSPYLLAERAGHIVGLLPITFVSSRLFGRILCSVPFLNFGGPVAEDETVERALVNAACREAEWVGADYLELRCPKPIASDLPSSMHKISMTIALPNDADALWSSFASKHRTNIRRAYKNDLRVEHGGMELLKPFYNILAESWRNLGTPIYRERYFRKILETFPKTTRIFVCYQGETPIAAAFNGYLNGVVEGLWAGVRGEYRAAQPNYVLYWEMMKHACEAGYAHYHLGRSTAESGAESFKKKWRADAKQLYWYYFLPKGGEIPELNVSNPKYQMAINTWRKLPIGLTTRIGPMLSRSIP